MRRWQARGLGGALLLLGLPGPLAAQGSPAPVLPSGTLRLSDVMVAGEGGMPAARRGWVPEAIAGDTIRLDHQAGEPLDDGWIKRQFAANGMIGAEVGFDRIAALVERINRAFLQNGYINSGVVIAPQDGDAAAGILRLRLVTGRFVAPAGAKDAIDVDWRDGHREGLSADYLRRRMPSARARPIDVNAIEHDFRLLTDDPAIRTITAELRPGTAQGEASLALTVDPQPRYDAYIGFANSRSPSVGGERVSVGGSMRNALTSGDVLSGEYGRTRGLSDLVAGYSAPLFTPGTTVQLQGGFNNAAVVDRPLVPLDIHSREYFVEGGLRRTLLAEPLLPGDVAGTWRAARSASAGVTIVHRQVIATLLGERFSFSPGAVDGRTEYTALRLNGDFTRRSPGAVLAVTATATIGIEGTKPDIPGLLHPSEHFTALLVQANYARRLDGHGLELRLRLAGQAAGGLLYSSERFAVGGSYTVRGYRESLLLADEGVAGAIELAHPFDLGGARSATASHWGRFSLATFLDGAVVHNRRDPQPLPTAIAGAGATLDWEPTNWLSARLTLAQALRHVRATGSRNKQDRGISFRIVIRPIAALRGMI